MGDVAVLLTVARGAAAGNSIGDAGAAAIAEALKVNHTVTCIGLEGACRAISRDRHVVQRAHVCTCVISHCSEQHERFRTRGIDA